MSAVQRPYRHPSQVRMRRTGNRKRDSDRISKLHVQSVTTTIFQHQSIVVVMMKPQVTNMDMIRRPGMSLNLPYMVGVVCRFNNG